MIRALATASSGLQAQQLNLDLIANNLANVNTSGFKKSRIDFQELMVEQLRGADRVTSEGSSQARPLQIGLGVEPVATRQLFFQGGLTQTESPFDMAIQGEGFIEVVGLDGGALYTRDGSFHLDSDGNLVTASGMLMASQIRVPADAIEVTIDEAGRVLARRAGETESSEVGQIELVRFANPGGLSAVGGNLFRATAAAGEPQQAAPGTEGMGVVRQGFLERSNVQVVEEMVKMITAQRAFEINSRVVQAADEVLRTTNGLRT